MGTLCVAHGVLPASSTTLALRPNSALDKDIPREIGCPLHRKPRFSTLAYKLGRRILRSQPRTYVVRACTSHDSLCILISSPSNHTEAQSRGICGHIAPFRRLTCDCITSSHEAAFRLVGTMKAASQSVVRIFHPPMLACLSSTSPRRRQSPSQTRPHRLSLTRVCRTGTVRALNAHIAGLGGTLQTFCEDDATTPLSRPDSVARRPKWRHSPPTSYAGVLVK